MVERIGGHVTYAPRDPGSEFVITLPLDRSEVST
jgi:hypothetical protein